ncbi:MAG: hypothetical protein WA951_09495, partial [Leeuwenhoekiella sp.]
VSDGTFVEFIVENKEGMILKSSATTISGVATVKFLHPEQPEEWKLSANVTGMAKTPTILVDFRSVLEDFQIKLIRDANRIEVGPLESFLGQWVADGTTVRVEILDSNSKSILELQEPSEDGFAIFNLPSDKKNWNSYTFRIEAMGLIKLMDAGKDQ